MAVKRNSALDIARIAAALAVIMIHVSGPFLNSYELLSAEYSWANIFDGISRIGVPFFLMISGSLFLDERREVTLKSIAFKNIKPLAIITVIWAIIYSLIYNVVFPVLAHEDVSVKAIAEDIVYGHFHMWYLYMIIGLYMITPFLRAFVSKANQKTVLAFILISFAAQFLSFTVHEIGVRHWGVEGIVPFVEMFHLDFFGGYITYYLVGWYIVHVGIPQKRIRLTLYVLGALSLAGCVVYVHFMGNAATAYTNISAPMFVYAVSAFLALNNVRVSLSDKNVKRLAGVSKLTFGVYILHILVLAVFDKAVPYGGRPVLHIALSFAAVTIGSFTAAFVMSKIPLVKSLVKA